VEGRNRGRRERRDKGGEGSTGDGEGKGGRVGMRALLCQKGERRKNGMMEEKVGK